MSGGGVSTKLLLFAGSLAALFLLIEIGLRVAGFEPLGVLRSGRAAALMLSDDPVLGYVTAPDVETSAWRTDVRTDRLGLRRGEPGDPVSGRGGVLAIGDSVTLPLRRGSISRGSSAIGVRSTARAWCSS